MEYVTFSRRAKSKKKLVCAVKEFNRSSNIDRLIDRYEMIIDIEIRFQCIRMQTNGTVHIKNLFGTAEKRD